MDNRNQALILRRKTQRPHHSGQRLALWLAADHIPDGLLPSQRASTSTARQRRRQCGQQGVGLLLIAEVVRVEEVWSQFAAPRRADVAGELGQREPTLGCGGVNRTVDPGDVISKRELADCFVRQDQVARAVPLLRSTGDQFDAAFATQYGSMTGPSYQRSGHGFPSSAWIHCPPSKPP